jgi:hypothetical protein
MSSFTTPLDVRHLDGKRWMVLDDFAYEVGHEGSGEIITARRGFITDFASIPRALWWLYNPTGPHGKAAVIHDLLYWLNGRPVPETGKMYNRLQSDQIFLEGMTVLGIRASARATMYRSLRICGGPAWKAHTKRIEQECLAGIRETVREIWNER